MKQKGICMKRIIYIVTACVFVSVSTVKAQRIYSLRDCLEEGLQNNYSLRIVHNEEQISKNNATLWKCGLSAYFGLFLPDIPETWTISRRKPAPPERSPRIMESTTRQLTSASTSTGPSSTDSISALRTSN